MTMPYISRYLLIHREILCIKHLNITFMAHKKHWKAVFSISSISSPLAYIASWGWLCLAHRSPPHVTRCLSVSVTSDVICHSGRLSRVADWPRSVRLSQERCIFIYTVHSCKHETVRVGTGLKLLWIDDCGVSKIFAFYLSSSSSTTAIKYD